jgi:fructokinase
MPRPITVAGIGEILWDVLDDNEELGDVFTAATVLGKLLGRPLAAIADHANQLAAYVCTCQGAMPPIPSELKLL